MKHMTHVANILRGIIAVLLAAVIVILLVKNNHKNTDVQVIPVAPVVDQSVETSTPVVKQNTANENFVHPPAEGKFISDGVRNFKSTYDKSTRIMTIEAEVAKGFFFEATAGYKVYNSDGVLVINNGFQPTLAAGEDYISTPKSHLPSKVIFTVPPTVRNGETMVFRFIADNPSGLDQYSAYWGTTIKVQ